MAERFRLYLPIALSAGLYIFIGYFVERYQATALFSAYIILFGCYLWLVYQAKPCSVVHFILVGLALRLLLLFSFPSLSDDIFRFVWDGRLLQHGINPFSVTPATYIASGALPGGLTPQLYQQLNSPDYFTIYPPLAQFIFWLSVVLSPGSVFGSAVVMRLLIILAEIGTIYLLLKLADHYQVARKNVLWYALNPLVILELTGNLHYEAFMIFFLLLAFYLLLKEKTVWAALFVALAISVKLVPLILLPLFIRRLEKHRLLRFYGFTALFVAISFTPLLSHSLIAGMTKSLELYFQKFEFNASLYYIIRAIGFQVKGYNIIGTAGPYLAGSAFILIMGFSLYFKKIKLPEAAVWVLLIYLLLATTVHPWYVIPLLAFSVLTTYRFVVLWTALVFLTYAGYTKAAFEENLWLTAFEYSVLMASILYETFKINKKKTSMAGG